MPELSWALGYRFAPTLMPASRVILDVIFGRRNWLEPGNRPGATTNGTKQVENSLDGRV